jgi:hypothetical protein
LRVSSCLPNSILEVEQLVKLSSAVPCALARVSGCTGRIAAATDAAPCSTHVAPQNGLHGRPQCGPSGGPPCGSKDQAPANQHGAAFTPCAGGRRTRWRGCDGGVKLNEMLQCKDSMRLGCVDTTSTSDQYGEGLHDGNGGRAGGRGSCHERRRHRPQPPSRLHRTRQSRGQHRPI